MKKKFLIGALGLASVFAMTSATDEYAENARRPMFGKVETYVSDCTPCSTNPDGSQMCMCTQHYTQYIFWIGFEGESRESMPCGQNPISPGQW
ncbi:hypothetical protein GSF70_02010 [Flavobacteriaceae bacterium W22]|nr:hypothetical protein [Flavobacteriaceae bacterium W22]